MISETLFFGKEEEILDEIKTLQGRSFVIICLLIDFEHLLSSFIDAGVHDCVTPLDRDRIVDIIENALNSGESRIQVSRPLIDKLTSRLNNWRRNYLNLFDTHQWYLDNLWQKVCDCREQIKSGEPYRRPKSTVFEKLGTASDQDGFQWGDYFLCKVCGTKWVLWTDNLEEMWYQWQLVDEKVKLIRDEK